MYPRSKSTKCPRKNTKPAPTAFWPGNGQTSSAALTRTHPASNSRRLAPSSAKWTNEASPPPPAANSSPPRPTQEEAQSATWAPCPRSPAAPVPGSASRSTSRRAKTMAASRAPATSSARPAAASLCGPRGSRWAISTSWMSLLIVMRSFEAGLPWKVGGGGCEAGSLVRDGGGGVPAAAELWVYAASFFSFPAAEARVITREVLLVRDQRQENQKEANSLDRQGQERCVSTLLASSYSHSISDSPDMQKQYAVDTIKRQETTKNVRKRLRKKRMQHQRRIESMSWVYENPQRKQRSCCWWV